MSGMLADPEKFQKRIEQNVWHWAGVRWNHLWLEENEKEDIGTDGTELGKFLATDKTLVELAITHNQFGDKGVQDVAKGLQTNTSLHNLYLNLPALSDKGVQSLAEAIIINRKLKLLFLFRNKLGAAGVKSVVEIIQTRALRKLYLDRNQLGDAGAMPILKAVETDDTLESLDLTNNGLTDNSCRAIANVIKHNRTLTAIDLRRNKFTDIDTLRSLASALEENPILQELHLQQNSFDPLSKSKDELENLASLIIQIKGFLERNKKMAQEIAFMDVIQQIKDNTTPDTLDLSEYHITLEQASVLGAALNSNKSIKQLRLSSNECGDDGVYEIAQGLVHNQTLTSLTIHSIKHKVGVGEKGMRAIANALKDNTTLLKFNYSPHKKEDDSSKYTDNKTELEKAEITINQILCNNRTELRIKTEREKAKMVKQPPEQKPQQPLLIAASGDTRLQNRPTQPDSGDVQVTPNTSIGRQSQQRKYSTNR